MKLISFVGWLCHFSKTTTNFTRGFLGISSLQKLLRKIRVCFFKTDRLGSRSCLRKEMKWVLWEGLPEKNQRIDSTLVGMFWWIFGWVFKGKHWLQKWPAKNIGVGEILSYYPDLGLRWIGPCEKPQSWSSINELFQKTSWSVVHLIHSLLRHVSSLGHVCTNLHWIPFGLMYFIVRTCWPIYLISFMQWH